MNAINCVWVKIHDELSSEEREKKMNKRLRQMAYVYKLLKKLWLARDMTEIFELPRKDKKIVLNSFTFMLKLKSREVKFKDGWTVSSCFVLKFNLIYYSYSEFTRFSSHCWISAVSAPVSLYWLHFSLEFSFSVLEF